MVTAISYKVMAFNMKANLTLFFFRNELFKYLLGNFAFVTKK